MFPAPLIALGATLGTATGLLALCGLTFLCTCLRSGKKPLDWDQKGRKTSVLQPHQQFSIQKSTEPVQPRTLLKTPWIYKVDLVKTSPQTVNVASDDMRKSAEETMRAAEEQQGSDESGGLDLSSEDIFILSADGGEDGGTLEDLSLEMPLTSQAPKLRYFLGYDCQRAELCVSFLEAFIRSSEVNQDTACDCYILGSLTTSSGTLEARTGLVRKASYMTWKDQMLFPLPQEEQAEASLSITLWNCDKFSRQSILGQGKFNVEAPCGTDGWVHLKVPEEAPAAADIAEVLLAISYLPAANRLIVVLIKARNLHLCTRDLQGRDVSVKLTLWHQDLKLRKKHSKQSRKQINPVWNEMIMFELPQEFLETSCVELEMFCQETRSQQTCFLGRCHLGLQFEGTERSHWQEMMKNPRRQIAKWYTLCQ